MAKKATGRKKPASKRPPKQGKGSEQADVRRAQYLGLREQGLTRVEACKQLGISYSCPAMWRSRDPEFRATELEAREAGLDHQRARLRRMAEALESTQPQVAIAAINALFKAENLAVHRMEISGPGGGPIRQRQEIAVEDEAIAEAIARWADRLSAK